MKYLLFTSGFVSQFIKYKADNETLPSTTLSLDMTTSLLLNQMKLWPSIFFFLF